MGQLDEPTMEEGIYESDGEAEAAQPPVNPKKRKGSYKEKLLLMKKQRLEGTEAQGEPTAPRKPNDNALYRQPTADELNQLRETENLFNSNVFRLQIDELLDEVRVKPKYEKIFAAWLESFSESLETMMEFKDAIPLKDFRKANGKKLGAQQRFINEVVNDLQQQQQQQHNVFGSLRKADGELAIKFCRPVHVTRLASYSCISSKDVKFAPSICIAMPKEIMQPKSDFLYSNYAVKKYYYLMYVMQHIRALDIVKEVRVERYLGNPWLPILTIVPSAAAQIAIRLFAVPETDTFKIKRFLPHNNNVKVNILGDAFSSVPVADFCDKGSPLMNAVLAHDSALLINNAAIEESLSGLQNVQDGLKLLAVWLKQRRLSESYVSFTDDLLQYLAVYLIGKKKITKHMSSYQVIRKLWHFLGLRASSDLLSICSDVKLEDLANFRAVADFVLVDASGCLNVAAFLDADIFGKVKREAAMAIANLDRNRFSTFGTLFITGITHGIQYDALLKVRDSDGFRTVFDGCDMAHKFRYFGFYELLVRKRLADNLKTGLGDRALEVVPILLLEGSAPGGRLAFGINLNPEACADLIVKGPRQFDVGAAAFKDFWGPLAELRRFKDTSIHEAVYFADAKTVQDRRGIYKRIIRFVLREKMNLSYTLNGSEMERILKVDNIVAPFPTGSSEEATLKVKAIHYQLTKMLRDLALPLPVTAIQGFSSVYSYTMCYPPIPTKFSFNKHNTAWTKDSHSLLLGDALNCRFLPRHVEPVECVVELGMHAKWPRQLAAMRAMKTMFLFEMSDLLWKEKHVRSTVRREGCIDVLYEGLVFRLWLHHPKEIGHLMRNVSADGVVHFKDSRESLLVESRFKVLPKIVGALNGLQQECPSFGPSSCLIKRWTRAQMLDESHVPDVALDLLNASLHLAPEPFSAPALPQVAFLRFLKFVAEFDFHAQPVVVNFNGILTGEQLAEFEDGRFQSDRTAFRDLHIVTPYDDGRSLFTREAPNKDVLRVLAALARATYLHLTDCLVSQDSSFKFKSVFVPNTSGYNLMIHLAAKCVLNNLQSIGSTSTNVLKVEPYEQDGRTRIPVVAFDPIRIYLSELRKNYGDIALFFYDPYGGDQIGVLWRKKMLEPNEFKILNVPARHLQTDGDGKLSLNADALMEDFKCLGMHCVQSVEKIQ